MAILLDKPKCDKCGYEDNLFIVASHNHSLTDEEMACGWCCQDLSIIAFPLDTLEVATVS